MLESLRSRLPVGQNVAAWITRMARIFWGLVEVAVPRSFASVIFRYWIRVLYLLETFLFAVGLLLGVPQVQNLGLVTFVITLMVNVAVMFIGEYMRGAKGQLALAARLVIVALLLVLALLALLGILEVFAMLGNPTVRNLVGHFEQWLQ
jgi:hypothetical protein